ncbi:hypothetical protein GCM10010340_60080 [Streptomyces griseoloalbus]|nr:hypothetical protein GCM10010340_60080 [Streptomyces albaduncus]
MRTVGGLHCGSGLGVRLRGHATEGRSRRRRRDIGGLSAVGDFPRQVVDNRRTDRTEQSTGYCRHDKMLSSGTNP